MWLVILHPTETDDTTTVQGYIVYTEHKEDISVNTTVHNPPPVVVEGGDGSSVCVCVYFSPS